MGEFRFLDHMALADCAVDLEGRDLNDLFETAARALAELMVDPATVPETIERTLALTAPGADLLLYDWLSELIFRKDRDGEVFPRTRVRVTGDGPVRLEARLMGGPIRPGETRLRADPKAVTFHQFALAPTPGGFRARVVIDI